MARERERSVILQDFNNTLAERRPSAVSVVSIVSYNTPSWPPAELLPPVPTSKHSVNNASSSFSPPSLSLNPTPAPAGPSLFSADYSLTPPTSATTVRGPSNPRAVSEIDSKDPLTDDEEDDEVAGALAALPLDARRNTTPNINARATLAPSDVEIGDEGASTDATDERTTRAKSLASCEYSNIKYHQCPLCLTHARICLLRPAIFVL